MHVNLYTSICITGCQGNMTSTVITKIELQLDFEETPNFIDIWTLENILGRKYEQYIIYPVSRALLNDFRIHRWKKATENLNNIRMDKKFPKRQ